MGFGQSIKTVYSKYATFSGRASRSEFWWFFLFSFLVTVLFSTLNRIAHGAGIVAGLLTLRGVPEFRSPGVSLHSPRL